MAASAVKQLAVQKGKEMGDAMKPGVSHEARMKGGKSVSVTAGEKRKVRKDIHVKAETGQSEEYSKVFPSIY